MPETTPKTIQQQLYTRARQGIFRSTEGFDTIAKSEGLEGAYVKKHLHPLCGYDAPAELTARGERDDAAYPAAVHLVHLDNGDVVLGRSIYQAADFTGLRSAFFTHNYVIPAARSEEVVGHYDAWLRSDYGSYYPIEAGSELPELDELPQSSQSFPRATEVLRKLKVDEHTFKQLVYAVLTAVSSRKKMYVALDVPIGEMSDAALQLLDLLYAALPYAIRRQLGFITYSKEPQSRKGIHLTFVEKGSLRPGDRSIEKDFVFDLPAGRILNVNIDTATHPYLDFVWKQLGRREVLEQFSTFADEQRTGLAEDSQSAIADYDELTVLFQVEAGDEEIYQQHKTEVLRTLLTYLRVPGIEGAKRRLSDLFLACFDREFDEVNKDQVPTAEIAECMRDYYRVDNRSESKIVSYFIKAIIAARKKGLTEQVRELYNIVQSIPVLGKAFFTTALSNSQLSRLLFEPYMEEQIKGASSAEEILELVERWGLSLPKLLEHEPTLVLAEQQLEKLLRQEKQLLRAAEVLHDKLQRMEHSFRREWGPIRAAMRVVENLETVVNLCLLTNLELERITRKQLAGATFLEHQDVLFRSADQLFAQHQAKARLLHAAYQWFTLPKPDKHVFAGLSSGEREQLQALGRSWLREGVDTQPMERLVLAFYNDPDSGWLDYPALIEFIHSYAQHKETVYRLFTWSEDQPDFIRGRVFVPAYEKAIEAHIKQHDRDTFKKRNNVKELLNQAGPRLSRVYNRCKSELASPIAKLLRQNRRAYLIISILCIGILVTAVGLLMVPKDKAGSGTEFPPGGTANNGTTNGGQGIGNTSADNVKAVLVYVEPPLSSDDLEKNTVLTFRFQNAAACEAFPKGAITASTEDGQKLSYLQPEYTVSCPGAEEEGNAAGDGSSTPDDNVTAIDGSGSTSDGGGQAENQGSSTTSDESAAINKGKTTGGTEVDEKGTAIGTGTASNDSAIPSDSGTGNNSGTTSNEAADVAGESPSDSGDQLYPGKVMADLGDNVVLPVGTTIKMGTTEYTIAEPPQ